MRVVVQKCLESSVSVDGKVISSISKGLMILVGFTHNDTEKDLDFLVNKVVNCDDNINHIIRTLRSFLEGFSLLVNNNAFGNPISIKESFDLSLEIIMNGIKSLEGVK